MNRQKFVEFIRKPGNLTSKNLEEIEEVLDAYPYFQNARIILAKGSKIKDDPNTKQRIATAAVYATDRGLLKKYINDELIFLRTLKVHESASIQKPTKAPESTPAPPVPKAAEAPKPIDTNPATDDFAAPPKPDKNEVPDTSAFEQENRIAKQEETAKKEEIFPQPTSSEHSDLDDLIEDLWKDVEQMRKSKARFEEIEKRLEEDEAVDKAVKKATQKSNTPAKAKSTTEKKTTKKSSTTKKSTTKKAASTAKKPVAKKTSNKSTTKKKDEAAGEKKSAKKEDKGDPQISQGDIINQFIKTNPSMPPASPNQRDTNIGDLSEGSTDFHPEIASEYLAEIFLEQGKKERAVEIYQTLSLKFPEKKSYFAALIKKLK